MGAHTSKLINEKQRNITPNGKILGHTTAEKNKMQEFLLMHSL